MLRPVVIAILGVLVLGLVLPSNTYVLPSPSKTYATTHNITLNGSAGVPGWNGTSPGPTITVAENDSVIMSLRSTDAAPHQLYIDTNGRFDPVSDCGSGVDKCSLFFGDTYPNPITYSFNVTLPAGTYTYYCSIHPFMVGTFAVQGFRMSSSPNSLTVLRGFSAMSSIALTSFNGFSGTASVSAIPSSPALLTSLNSSSVPLAAGGTSAASLNVTVPSTVAVGTYNVLVKATIGSISHTTNVAVVVKKPTFSLSPSPPQLVILQGFSKTTSITLTSLNTFNGTVGLSASPPAGVTTTFAPPSVMLTSGQSATSVLNVTIASNAVSGEYNLTLTGTSTSETNTTNVRLVIGQDFNLTASPLNLTFPQGSSANSTITLTSLNSFKGDIILSSPNTPVGLAVSFNTTSVNLSANQTAYASVRISALQSTAARVYNVIVAGTNSTRVRSVSLNITVSGFTIQTSIALFNLAQGGAGSSMITLTSINGFSGTMNLAVTGSSALTSSLTLSSASLNANENLTVALSISANSGATLTPRGSYVFNVTGTVRSLSHSTTVTVTVTALPPASGTFPTTLVAGASASVIALLSIILFLRKRRGVKAKTPSVPPSN